MRMLNTLLALVTLITLASCSTDSRYTVTHERLTTAAILAVAEEAHVKPESVQRTDKAEKGGVLTHLEAPYIDYSKIKVEIDSRGDQCNAPELEVKITTGDVVYSRHKEWEQRIQELVRLKLLAHPHGAEARPTSLPPPPPPPVPTAPSGLPVTPVTPAVPPPATPAVPPPAPKPANP